MVVTIKLWSGREIRALRDAKRMSIRQFAGHLGVGERLISKWEAGGEKLHPRPINQEALDTCLAGLVATLEDDTLRKELQAVLPDDAPDEAALRERHRALEERLRTSHPKETETIRNVLTVAGTRAFLRWNTERARRLDLWMRVWRWVHVPVSVALFFLVAVHVWMVLAY